MELRIGVLNLNQEISRHAVGSDGSLLFQAPADSPGNVFGVAPRLPPQVVTVTAIDVASVPRRDRVRGTLRLIGPMQPAPEPLPVAVRTHLAGPDPREFDTAGPLLRLQPTRVALAWHCESGRPGGHEFRATPAEEYCTALPAPLLPYEARWLPNLNLDHSEVLRTLAAHECGGELGDAVDVRPLAQDQFGLVLRLYTDAVPRDVRLAFRRVVSCGCEIREAFNDLLQRAAPHSPGCSCQWPSSCRSVTPAGPAGPAAPAPPSVPLPGPRLQNGRARPWTRLPC